MANRGGTPGGRTGSSTDGSTCATNGGCHGNNNSTATAQDFITSDIPSTGYEIGETYTITVSPSKSGVSIWGFEMMAEGAGGDGVGSFTGNSEVNTLEGGIRATHKFASSSNSDGQTWSVEWTAPEQSEGEISFYAASLAANGTGNTNGDNVLFDTLKVSSNGLTNIQKVLSKSVTVYPNPVINVLNVKGLGREEVRLTLLDAKGNKVLQQSFESESGVDISRLSSGTYFASFFIRDETIFKTIIKE